MKRGYLACTDERGKGSYMRMKQHMSDHVERVKSRMFSLASGDPLSHPPL